MPLLALLVLIIGLPIAEIYVIVKVGEAIGVLWTIALLVADSVLGTWLLRAQGRAAWRRFNAAIAARRPPGREAVDGALILLGGALLVTPGFVTDVFGLVLLLPPTRALVRLAIVRNFTNRLVVGFASFPRRARPGGHAYDYEGTAEEIDPPSLPR